MVGEPLVRLSGSGVYLLWAVSASVGLCQAGILNQTDFENGTVAPWKMFVTPNGTLGKAGWPEVVSFETTKNETVAKALRFKVGQVRYDQDTETEQGGGLVFQTTMEAGLLDLSANVAVSYHSPKDTRNLAGGLFEWVVDDVRHRWCSYLIRLRIIRPFVSQPGQQLLFKMSMRWSFDIPPIRNVFKITSRTRYHWFFLQG